MICVCMVMFSVVVGLFVISSLGWYNKVIVIMICWCMLLENLCGYIFMCLCVFGIFIVLSICIDFLNVLVLFMFLCSISIFINCLLMCI